MKNKIKNYLVYHSACARLRGSASPKWLRSHFGMVKHTSFSILLALPSVECNHFLGNMVDAHWVRDERGFHPTMVGWLRFIRLGLRLGLECIYGLKYVNHLSRKSGRVHSTTLPSVITIPFIMLYSPVLSVAWLPWALGLFIVVRFHPFSGKVGS